MTSTSIDIKAAILNGTLSDGASLTELQRRREYFAADTELLDDIKQRGLSIFDSAIDTDAPQAISKEEPVVSVLKRALKAIGQLYVENAQRVAAPVVIKPVSQSGNILEYNEAVDIENKLYSEEKNGVKAEADQESQHELEDNVEDKRKKRKREATPSKRMISEADRLAIAAETRRKRKLLTHGPSKAAKNPMTSSNGEREVRETHSPEAFTVTARSRNSRGTRSKLSKQTDDDMGSSPESSHRPSLIVNLKLAKPFIPPLSPKRSVGAKRRKKPRRVAKSSKFVDSDADEDKGEEQETSNNEMRSPSSQKLLKHTTNTVLSSQRKRRGAISEPTTTVPDVPSTNSAGETESAKSTSSTEPPTPPLHHPTSYPPFPQMPEKNVDPFNRGVQIALENILLDSQDEPDWTLLEVVEELEDTRPIMHGWEHQTVLKGGTYVYEAMREVWGEAVEKGCGMDVGEVVEGMGKWVEGEVRRLGV